MSQTMSAEDYRIEGHDARGHLHIVGRFSSAGMEWPATLEHKGRTYRFASNEAMEDYMAGRVHGHARYVPIEPSAPKSDRDQ